MQLKTLQLINFKNYAECRIDFTSDVNVLVGRNGSGKTNLLDAIYYLALTKSAFSSADNYCVRQGADHFFLKGIFQHTDGERQISSSFQTGSRKIFKDGLNEYQKLSDHIGRYPVVLIAPDDTGLVREGSEGRRKFFDGIISQLDRGYLESLIQYHQTLKQRNSLLKMFYESGRFDATALETYDDLLIRIGSAVYEKRKEFIIGFAPVFVRYYNSIIDNEPVQVHYSSALNEISFAEGLRRNRSRDQAMQRTCFGVHRDDYAFTLGNGELRRLGSQGQQKSFIIALKLAQFEVIKTKKGFSPLLLLDDIFDKLDDIRIERLLQLIKAGMFGQLFITDARPGRTTSSLSKIGVTSAIFQLEDQIFTRLPESF